MTVFKAYMKIAKKNAWLIVMYMGIFFTLTVMFQGAAKKQDAEGYTAEGTKIGIVDEDGGVLAESLAEMLGRRNELVRLPNAEESLQEALFYREVEYIVRIPEGFEERCIAGEEHLQVTAVPGTYAGSYVDQQISSFINSARTFRAAGFSARETAEAAAVPAEPEIRFLDITGNGGEADAYVYYYRYLPFLFLSVICYILGYILIGFRKGSLPARMRASAVSGRRQTMEGLLASFLLALGVWTVCTAVAFLMYGESMLKKDGVIYYILNSAALLAVSLTLAYLIGMIVRGSDSLNGIINIVSLGMCFVCGTFVELDLISPAVRKAAQFLPVYWYETVNNLLADYKTITGSLQTEVLQGIGIQLVFAAAFVCITLAVSRKRM